MEPTAFAHLTHIAVAHQQLKPFRSILLIFPQPSEMERVHVQFSA